MRPLSLLPALAAALCLAPGLPARAAGLESIDLVPGWTTSDGAQMVGIRIRLSDGWKTYWRSPGDTGIPPSFDFSGSENLAAARLYWPRPVVEDSFGQRSIIYRNGVLLPVELIPQDATRPVTIVARADLGVCRDVCIPVSAPVRPAAQPDAPAIRAALAARPDRGTMGPVTCTITPVADGIRLSARMRVPPQGADEVAVFELPRADVWVSETVTERAGDTITATADLVPPEAAPFAFDRSALRITIIGRHGAAERTGCSPG